MQVIIKKLKQPKVNSGKVLVAGESCTVKGIKIMNQNKYSVSVSTYERTTSAPKKKVAKKAKK